MLRIELKTAGQFLLSVAAVATVNLASAQYDGEMIEEVVVTAQKREERLIEVPQSVSVMLSEDLEKLNATQFKDFASTIPSLNFTTSGPGTTQVSMRGVTAGADINQTVAIYVDEVPYGSSTSFGRSGRYTPDGSLFDLERIEVLRGPQGTLYGASSMGGLIKYVTSSPDLYEFSGRVLGSLSETSNGGSNYNLAGVVNAPLNEKVALRASGYYTEDGGSVDNVAFNTADVNNTELYGARVDLLVAPSEEFTIRLVAEYQSISRDGTPEVDFTAVVGGRPVFGDLEQSRTIKEPFEQEFRLFATTINYEFDFALLTSITSYQETETENIFDISPEFVPLLAFLGLGDYSGVGLTDLPSTDKLTQEIRLTSPEGDTLDWSVGAFYTKEESERGSEMVVLDTDGQLVPNIFYTLSAPSNYEEYAVFGNVTWHLTDQWDIGAGVRYAYNDQDYTQFGSGIFIGDQPTAYSDEGVATYLLNSSYFLSEQATVYARFATGYRPGGPNFVARDANGVPVSPLTFDADRVKSYELGYKGESSDRRLAAEVAVYYVDWTDIQIFDLSSPFGGFINGDEADIRGSEMSVTVRPVEGLTVNINGNYSEARRSGVDTDGQYSATLIADYDLPGNSEYAPFVGATVNHVSERKNSITTNVDQELPAYTTVDLRAGVDVLGFEAQLFARNVFDKRGRLSLLTASGQPVFSILQPRTIGISFSRDF